MIDIEHAKEEFKKYAGNYDINEKRIKLKFYHSFRVMEQSTKIAESLNLSEEDIKLATLIGLLHDIARFEQWKIYKVFSDKLSFDHGDKAVEILEKEDFIRKFISDDKYDNIIKFAIKNHNKFEIDNSITDERTLLHAKIIRDADKLDIFYEAAEMFWDTYEEKYAIENSDISDSYFNQFMNKKQIFIEKNTTKLDSVIAIISFIFDLSFDYSRNIVFKTKHVQNILSKFDFKKEETKRRIEQIEKVIIDFLKNN